MEQLKFHPLDLRLEAAGALTRMAYHGDSDRSGDLRTAVDYYCKKYNTDRSRFSGMLEAYEHVKTNLVCEEQELMTLFGCPDGMETNLYDLLRQVFWRLSVRKEGTSPAVAPEHHIVRHVHCSYQSHAQTVLRHKGKLYPQLING